MKFRGTFAIAFCLVQATAFSATGDSEDFLIQQMSLVPRTISEYCSLVAPEFRDDLDAAYRDFSARLDEAAAPVLHRFRTQGAFSIPVPAEERARLAGITQQMLTEIKKIDPHPYCTQFVSKLRVTDPKVLVAAAEQAYAKYLSAANGAQATGK